MCWASETSGKADGMFGMEKAASRTGPYNDKETVDIVSGDVCRNHDDPTSPRVFTLGLGRYFLTWQLY